MNKLLGISFIVIILVYLGKTFIPVVQQEINYRLNKVETFTKTTLKTVNPVDTDFGVVIDKISANAPVIRNIDPYDENDYQKAFTVGVAHVDGSALPGQKGNIFLFSHNSADSFKSSKFNQVFYLLSKLESGDEIKLYYDKEIYKYSVTEKKILPRSTVEFLSESKVDETLTIMTTYPPATSLMRVLVQATRIK